MIEEVLLQVFTKLEYCISQCEEMSLEDVRSELIESRDLLQCILGDNLNPFDPGEDWTQEELQEMEKEDAIKIWNDTRDS